MIKIIFSDLKNIKKVFLLISFIFIFFHIYIINIYINNYKRTYDEKYNILYVYNYDSDILKYIDNYYFEDNVLIIKSKSFIDSYNIYNDLLNNNYLVLFENKEITKNINEIYKVYILKIKEYLLLVHIICLIILLFCYIYYILDKKNIFLFKMIGFSNVRIFYILFIRLVLLMIVFLLLKFLISLF